MKKIITVSIFIFSLAVLSGCLYPNNELAKNQVTNDAQLEMVQTAVESYQEQNNGIVPIKTKENDVPIYEKYLIDFTLLKEGQFLTETPATAYENGGFYQYVLVTPEDDPQVKVIDLRITDKLRELNIKLNDYRVKNLYPPFGKQLADDVYQLNHEKLGYKSAPVVVSPFSNEPLPIIMNTDGDLFVDYRIDLKNALDTFDHTFKNGDDIRPILEQNYPFVPAYSLPYTIEDGDPVFLNK